MSDLDARMRQVLLELSMVSHGQTSRYDRSVGDGTRLAPPGESKPDADYWRDRYAQARTDQERESAYEGARSALEAIKRRPKPPPSVDPEKARWDRICSESQGERDTDVAFAYGVSLHRLHKARKQRGQDPMTGEQLHKVFDRDEVLRLRAEGNSIRQIALLSGLSPTTVHRLLEKI